MDIANFDYAANPGINYNIYHRLQLHQGNPHSNHSMGKLANSIIDNVSNYFLQLFPNFNNVEFISGGGTHANRRSILDVLPRKPKRSPLDKDVLFDTVLQQ